MSASILIVIASSLSGRVVGSEEAVAGGAADGARPAAEAEEEEGDKGCDRVRVEVLWCWSVVYACKRAS